MPELMKSVPSINEPVEFAVTDAAAKVTLQIPSEISGYKISCDQDPPQVCVYFYRHLSAPVWKWYVLFYYIDLQEEGGLCFHQLQATRGVPYEVVSRRYSSGRKCFSGTLQVDCFWAGRGSLLYSYSRNYIKYVYISACVEAVKGFQSLHD